ncbi:MAG: ADP-ribosylglycohydrolase family protein [Lachnospiraceae bacterium]|nr:ADP-ribosylglycohydrolase family protein [uncultured Acetatifactor sp.]MCI8544086.1 ADP-ribosylglycohydrolase family protein [Lachnospiraceae bacterium]
MRTISYQAYLDKIYGCYIGKAVSGNIGAPYEGVKMPLELTFQPEMIDCSLPNDDLDLQVLWLDVLERKGEHFSAFDLLDRFVNHCAYSPGEYAVMRKNYKRGIYPPYSGRFCNDYYREGMGCPIRSEIWGCVGVGNMNLAGEFASRDGQIDHYGESIWAERFLAALESEAFFEDDMNRLLDKALAVLPPDSKFRSLVCYTRELCEVYDDIKIVLTKLLFRYGHPDCTNLYQNMGITIAALLLGEGDIIKTSLLALNCGFDTDCTCATAGAVIGLLRGAEELIKAYGLTEVTYALGVQSDRRSNRIYDLAEDIARVGVQFSGTVNDCVEITGAPKVNLMFEAPVLIDIDVRYPDMDPSIALGESKTVLLEFRNRESSDKILDCCIETVNGICCSLPEFTLELPAGCDRQVSVVFTLPIDADAVYDRNIVRICAFTNGEEMLHKEFGLAGAVPWKLSGPFWRTEPICTTEALLANPSYFALMKDSRIQGSETDKVRHFHLNFAVDRDTEFIAERKLFEPLGKGERNVVYEQCLANVREDSFRLEDFFGFQGPCTAYFSRILIAPEDMETCIQIGHTCPFSLSINGSIVARRDGCDNWTGENVHLENIRLNRGENRIVLRVTRVNGEAKFNLTFSKEATCAEHIVSFASRNPYCF